MKQPVASAGASAGAIAGFLAFALSGCATMAYSSAPAKPGWTYLAGSRANRPQMWLCPEVPGQGECKPIEIEEIEQ